jgi:hypothetical protein
MRLLSGRRENSRAKTAATGLDFLNEIRAATIKLMDWLPFPAIADTRHRTLNHSRAFNFLPLFIPAPKKAGASPFSRGADVDLHPFLER